MSARNRYYWLRPTACRHGEVRWHVIEAPCRPTPQCMGPFATLTDAVSSAEPDGLGAGCDGEIVLAPTG